MTQMQQQAARRPSERELQRQALELDAPEQHDGYRTYSSSRYQSGKYYERDDTQRLVHVGGTAADGRHVDSHIQGRHGGFRRIRRGETSLRVEDVREMEQLLELKDTGKTDKHGRKLYKRDGFSGTYVLQTERDGSISCFYSGGKHQSGKRIYAQTFVNGQWDQNRRKALDTPPPKPPAEYDRGQAGSYTDHATTRRDSNGVMPPHSREQAPRLRLAERPKETPPASEPERQAQEPEAKPESPRPEPEAPAPEPERQTQPEPVPQRTEPENRPESTRPEPVRPTGLEHLTDEQLNQQFSDTLNNVRDQIRNTFPDGTVSPLGRKVDIEFNPNLFEEQRPASYSGRLHPDAYSLAFQQGHDREETSYIPPPEELRGQRQSGSPYTFEPEHDGSLGSLQLPKPPTSALPSFGGEQTIMEAAVEEYFGTLEEIRRRYPDAEMYFQSVEQSPATGEWRMTFHDGQLENPINVTNLENIDRSVRPVYEMLLPPAEGLPQTDIDPASEWIPVTYCREQISSHGSLSGNQLQTDPNQYDQLYLVPSQMMSSVPDTIQPAETESDTLQVSARVARDGTLAIRATDTASGDTQYFQYDPFTSRSETLTGNQEPRLRGTIPLERKENERYDSERNRWTSE